MAFTSRVRSVLGESIRRTVWIGLSCLLAAALLSACDDGPTETPGPMLATNTPTPTPVPPTSTPAPMPEPMATPSPLPATPTPTAEPIVASEALPATITRGQDVAPAEHDFSIDQDTDWQDLYDTFTDSEQSCIRTELGDELESALERPVMSGDETHPWDGAIFGCLSPETAVDVLVAIVTSAAEDAIGELNEEGETCVRNLLAGTNVAEMMAGTLPDADSNVPFQAFAVGLLACSVKQSLTQLGDSPPGSPLDDESLLWHFQTEGLGADSPAFSFGVVYAPTVADGVVYVGSDDNYVYALDAETGERLWRFETRGAIRSSPTVTDGAVYVGSNDRHVYALDRETGELLWRYDTGDYFYVQYSPPVSNGVVYVAAMSEGDRKVHALDGASRDVLWVAETPYPLDDELAPAVMSGKVYAPTGSGELHVLDASTGELLWSLDVSMGADSPPTVAGGVVYLTAVNTAYALDESTGELIWSYGTERFPARDSPAVVTDNVYYFSPDDHVYGLDTATGEVLWSYKADGMINTAPVAAEGMVYVGSESGRFYALDATTGGLVWSRAPMVGDLRSPTVVGGILYAESSDAFLRALSAATGEEIWKVRKGYFDGIPSYTVAAGVVYVGSQDGGVYAFTAPVTESGFPTKDSSEAYTKAVVQKAIQRYERDGRQATVDYYSTVESVDGQWYVFIINEEGLTIAHHNPKFLRRDPSLRVDPTGYLYGDELLGATEEGRWVDYVIVNPDTGENAQKHTWVVRHDGLLFASGWYEE